MTQLVLEEPRDCPMVVRYDPHTDTAYTNYIWMSLCGGWLSRSDQIQNSVLAELTLYLRYSEELSKLTFQEA